MCGICGIVGLDGRTIDENILRETNETLRHRGPDGFGYFVQQGIGLGHRRLSIIDLEGGKQPMGNEDGSIQVVFNGEIYNYLELKGELEAKGHRFKTRSDTESIIYGYLEWGDDFVKKLRGMFAIAVWDSRNKRLLMARDRIGKKPLYYHLGKDRIVFASELKALLVDETVPRDIDPAALDAYLSFGYVPSPLSIFKAIRKLPPAHMAIYSPSGFQIRPYWDLMMNEASQARTEEEVIEELLELFDEAVRVRLMSDVPLGAFLSGGVDSSSVVASMALQNGAKAVKTASIGFLEKGFNEINYARIVANLYKTDHTEFIVDPDALGVLEKIVYHLDEPFADASSIPTYYVCKMARQKVTVALSGDGGDETFAGYMNRYFMTRMENRIRGTVPHFFRKSLLGPLGRVYPKADCLPRPLRLKNFLTSLSLSLEEAYFRSMSFYFLPEMKERLYRPEAREAVDGFNSFEVLGQHFRENENPDITTRVQYIDIKTYLPEDILVKVDRMSMAHALEVRAPILDHKLMEYAGSLPSSFKLKKGVSKYIFKKAMEDRLPGEILYRRKQGFSIPLASWLRNELRGFAKETLFSSEARLNDYFISTYIKDIWRRHLGGIQDYSYPLWSLIMFELWHRRFLK
jgi:asparagine synthase (glutamine-hydrolysing)